MEKRSSKIFYSLFYFSFYRLKPRTGYAVWIALIILLFILFSYKVVEVIVKHNEHFLHILMAPFHIIGLIFFKIILSIWLLEYQIF
ncbi:hypothetical protein GDO86_003186 [Hymenochirus boettgeri]|uniref:Uncharacterized protein n=1 Tax=Hymenochirus boettgeri TaxID=247094 RepID=A0A8T2K8A6_9PIPI|nr:hypothetical protein GDO86_003186 [Hymenochirus boettgeri]